MSPVAPSLIMLVFLAAVIPGVVLMYKAKNNKTDPYQDRNRQISIGIMLCVGGVMFALVGSIVAIYMDL
jgi:cytochrome c biogenesis factor